MTRTHVPETGWNPVRVGDLSLAVFDEGDGPLVLLQHGFPDTPHTWDDLVPVLIAAGYRVVRPFGRGIAPSGRPHGDAFATTDLANDIVGILTALTDEPAIVVGHDWGAAAAWGAGHIAPGRIAKLVVVAIPHPAVLVPSLGKIWGVRHFLANRMPWAEARFRRGDFAEIRTMYERWSPGFAWPEAEFEAAKNAYAHPGCLSAALGYYCRLGPWPYRGKVACETLVIGGNTDGVATSEDFEASRRKVDGPCEVAMLPGGHFLHREHPEPFTQTLMQFLGPA